MAIRRVRARRRGVALDGAIPVSVLTLAPRQPRVLRERGSRTVTEYRVTWQRVGWHEKSKTYLSLKEAVRRVNLMTSKEPWKYFSDPKESGDEYVCCSGTLYGGYPCSCKGQTVAESCAEKFKDVPPVAWWKIETRRVTRTAWEGMLEADVPVVAPDENGEDTVRYVSREELDDLIDPF